MRAKPTEFWCAGAAWASKQLPVKPSDGVDADILDALIDRVMNMGPDEANTVKSTKKRKKAVAEPDEAKRVAKAQKRDEALVEVWEEYGRETYDGADEEKHVAEMVAWAEEQDRKQQRADKCSEHRRAKDAKGRRCCLARIFPDKEQRARLRDLFEAARVAHNTIVALVNQTEDKDMPMQDMRKAMGLVDGLHCWDHLPKHLAWVPRDVVDQAVRDCQKDCNSCRERLLRSVRCKVRKGKYRET